jgi:hypothetical protein
MISAPVPRRRGRAVEGDRSRRGTISTTATRVPCSAAGPPQTPTGTALHALPSPTAASSTGRRSMPSTSHPNSRPHPNVVVHDARRSTPRLNDSDSSHGPEAACLSRPSCEKEYRGHYTAREKASPRLRRRQQRTDPLPQRVVQDRLGQPTHPPADVLLLLIGGGRSHEQRFVRRSKKEITGVVIWLRTSL